MLTRFQKFAPSTGAKSSSDDDVVHYVFRVLWMTSHLPTVGQAKAMPIA